VLIANLFHEKCVSRFTLKKWNILKTGRKQNQFFLGNGDFETPTILQFLLPYHEITEIGISLKNIIFAD
jgi:hypothetical protein